MFKNITVIGAGTMGNGIAHVFAQNGFSVAIADVSENQLKKTITIIEKNFDRQIAKNILTQEQKNQSLKNITTWLRCLFKYFECYAPRIW